MISLRNKGTNHSSGKIIKGCIKDATTKLSIGSIPSPYQSIVYRTSNTQGFGTSSTRFYKNQKNCLTKQQIEKENDNSTNNEGVFKKQVHGTFLSKAKRQFYKPVRTPGVGCYRIPTIFSSKETNFRKTHTNFKLSKMEEKTNLKASRQQPLLPGPAHYTTSDFTRLSKNKGWKSSFVTNVARDSYIPISISPGPAHYITENKNNNNCQAQIHEINKQNRESQMVRNIVHPLINKKSGPGPHSYNQQIPDFKPLYEKVKISANFMREPKTDLTITSNKNYKPTFKHKPPHSAIRLNQTLTHLKISNLLILLSSCLKPKDNYLQVLRTNLDLIMMSLKIRKRRTSISILEITGFEQILYIY